MTVIECLIQHYSNRDNPPLSPREIAALYGTKWVDDEAQIAEFMRKFVICRDGIVRTR